MSRAQTTIAIYALIFLLIASVVIALITLARDSEQRNIQNVYIWLARFFVGGRWYQQMLWYAAFKPHASLVNRNDADARSAQAWQRLRDGVSARD